MYFFTKEEVLAPDSRIPISKRTLRAKTGRLLRKPVFWIVLVLMIAGITTIFMPHSKDAYVVMLDGKQLALVSDIRMAEEVYSRAKADLAKNVSGQPVWQNSFQVQLVKVPQDTALVDKSGLYSLIKNELSFEVMATAIEINGQQKVVLQDKASAEEVLNRVKEQFIPEQEGVEIESVSFEQQPELVPVEVEQDEIAGVDEAFNLLTTGEKLVKTHVVKEGDSLWTIARANDLWVEDILQANPGISEDTNLQPGLELKLVKAKPMLDVVVAYKANILEKTPYPVEVIKDDTLWRGQERVKQWGQYGEKEVLYRIVQRNGQEVGKQVLDEKVIKQPQRKIVRRGTKMMVASRGAGGNGELGWPLRGQITSRYGWRGREFHTGIDIDGKTGDPVLAAEEGTVIFAGWRGNYGYMVVIDHGDGLQTRYAHNSKLKVKMGDKVSRGDIIALVGSTGRSTGSHLHFEVLVNGDTRNPMRYLD